MSHSCLWDCYWNVLVSYWPIFSLSLVTVPEVFACPSFLLFSKALFTGWQGGARVTPASGLP